MVYGNFVEMLNYLKVDEKIRPVYYASFEVNVYGGFVFILHLSLFEKRTHTHTHTHIYRGGGMRAGDTITRQHQNCMRQLVSRGKG